MKLRKYQRRDVKKVLQEPTKGVINGSVMGAGKTAFGVGVLLEAEARLPVIVAPINTLDTWRYTLDALGGLELRHMNGVAGSNRGLYNQERFLEGEPGWYFVGWEYLLRMPFETFRHTDVLFDEIHRASSQKGAGRYGSMADVAHVLGQKAEERNGFRIGMSGTWKGNREEGAWAVLRAIWPSHEYEYRSFERWSRRHLERTTETIVVKTKDGPKKQELVKLGNELNPGSIVAEMPCYIRHEEHTRCCKSHPTGVQADLPARVIHRVGVDLSPLQRDIYDQLESEMMAWIDDNDWPISTKGYPMVQSCRLHQTILAVPSTSLATRLRTDKETGERAIEQYVKVEYAPNAKSSVLDAMLDVLRDIPEDEAVILCTHSAGIIPVAVGRINHALGARRGKPDRVVAEGWFGAVSHAARTGIKTRFLDRETRIIVAQGAAIAEGTDGLQRVCHNEIWLSFLDDRKINQQFKKRLHRDGQEHTVNVWEIYARDTIQLAQYERLNTAEKHMLEGLRAKR